MTNEKSQTNPTTETDEQDGQTLLTVFAYLTIPVNLKTKPTGDETVLGEATADVSTEEGLAALGAAVNLATGMPEFKEAIVNLKTAIQYHQRHFPRTRGYVCPLGLVSGVEVPEELANMPGVKDGVAVALIGLGNQAPVR